MNIKPLWSFPIVQSKRPYYVIQREGFSKRLLGNLLALTDWQHQSQELARSKSFIHLTPPIQYAEHYKTAESLFLRNNPWRLSVMGFIRPLTLLSYSRGYRTRPHGDYLPDDPSYGKMTCITIVSDQFTGGELVIGDDDAEPLKLRAGDSVVFPSAMVHRVNPVKSGTRIVLACWAAGPEFV